MKNALRWSLVSGVLLLFAWFVPAVQAQSPVVCPDPPNKVTVKVKGRASFDPATQLFTYQFEVFNDATSAQEVEIFALDFVPPISGITSPAGWSGGFFVNRTTIRWYASESAPLPPGAPDTGQVPPGLFQIKPGTSLGGFSFQSPNPPRPLTFYVVGFTPLPSAPTEEEAESLLALCPQISGTFFDLAVTGTVKFTVSFAAFTAKVEIKLGPLARDDTFEVKATATLGADSDGINPLTEDVSLQVGTFSTTIPAGSFKFAPARPQAGRTGKPAEFKFEGVIDGVAQEAKLTPLGANSFEFKAEGQNAELTGTVNPVPVELTIGDDEGTTTVTAEFK